MKGTIKALRDHANNLVDIEFNDLQMGQTLSYELGEGRDGRQQAIDVRLVEDEEVAA